MPGKPKRKPVLRYVVGALGILILAAIILYQPIIFGLAQFFAQGFAQSQKLDLRFRIRGSIFTDLFLEDVHLSALPENQSFPVEKLDAGIVGAKYRIWNFFKKDFREIIDLIQLKDVDVVLRPGTPTSPPPQEKPAGPLRIPPIIPKRIDIQNVNVRIHQKPDDLVVQGFNLDFGQDRQGKLTLSQLEVPPLGKWSNLQAQLAEQQGVISLRGLQLAPLLAIDDLGLNLSRLNESDLGIALRGNLLEAPLEAQLRFHQNQTDSSVLLRLKNLDLTKTKSLIALPWRGVVSQVEASISGDLQRPETWSGPVQLQASRLAYLTYVVDAVELQAQVTRGLGELSRVSITSGNDKISASGRFKLPSTFGGFLDQTSADLGIVFAVPQPQRFLPTAQGSLLGTGAVGLQNGRAQARVELRGQALALEDIRVMASKVELNAAVRLPLGQDLWKAVAVIVQANVYETEAKPAKVPLVEATIAALDGHSATVAVTASSGDSNVKVNAQTELPKPNASFDLKQILAQVELKVNSVNDFTMQNLVNGAFSADGHITVKNLQPDGFIRATGDQLRYQDFVLPHLALDATARDGRAEIRSLGLSFDPDNYAKITGSALLAQPLSFQTNGTIQFANLGALDHLLTALKQPGGLKGTLAANFTAQGDLQKGQPTGQLQVNGRMIAYRGLTLKSVEVNGKAAEGSVDIPTIRLAFDDRNTVTANATGSLREPYAYQSHAQVDFEDLGVFRDLLASLGKPTSVSGKLHATVDANGDAQTRLPHAELKASGEEIKAFDVLIQSLSLNADAANEEVNLRDFKLILDPSNTISATGKGSTQDPSNYQASGSLNFSDLHTFNGLLKAFGPDPGLSGKLSGSFVAKGQAGSKIPNADVSLVGDHLQYRGLVVQDLDSTAHIEDNKLDLPTLRVVFDQKNRIDAHLKAELNEPYAYDSDAKIDLTDLSFLDPLLRSLGQPSGVTGKLAADWQGKGELKNLGGALQVNGQGIAYRGLKLKSIDVNGKAAGETVDVPTIRLTFDDRNTVTANATGALREPYAYQSHAQVDFEDLGVFRDLLASLGRPTPVSGKLHATVDANGNAKTRLPHAELKASGQQIKAYDMLIQGLSLNADSANEEFTLHDFKLTFDSSNTISATGRGSLQDPSDYQASGSLNFSDLHTFNGLLKAFGPDPGLSGKLSASFAASGQAGSKIPKADISVIGDHLQYRGLVVQDLDTTAHVADNKLDFPNLRVVFDQKNRIEAHGRAELNDPYPYESNAKIDLTDLSFLDPLLRSFGQASGATGKLTADWRGKGELKNSDGELQLHADRVGFGNIRDIKSDIEGAYHGLQAEFTRISVNSPYADLQTTLKINPELLEIPSLTIRRQQNALNGNVRVPLNFQPGSKIPIAMEKPLEINLRGDRLPLASFQADKPQVTGTLDLLVQASGALQDLDAKIHVGINDLKAAAASSFSAARGAIDLNLANKVLNLNGDFTQPEIQPAQIRGTIPLDIKAIVENGKINEDTPLQLSVKWPDTNLAFLKKISPQIKIVEGRVAIDGNVGGTLRKPQVTGAVRANVSRFQAKTDVVPPVSNFVVNINFRQDHITFDQFNGLAGGGPFGLRGNIDLTKGTDPGFDLRINGREVLLTRSDNVIVRSDLDLAVRGPLSAGEVSGKVGVTNSRFFQDIDILPLDLPGRPAPHPPAVPAPQSVSIQTPPLNNWKFNIDVKTDKVFRVESNLARGQVTINLHVGGTGANPTVTGFVRVDNLTASLPFSHLNITNGFVNFPPGGNPFDPILNIVGTSQVRDYDIRVRIFGNVSNFQILFDSTPPLSQGDIATLLATGATTSEYVDNPSLLAGRATFILVQQLLTKVFKLRPNPNTQSFLERLQVDVIPGSRPGTQDISARFALDKNWQIIGDVGQGGEVAGRLRYLIRFR
jgi:autotransporter translocation and assembly factor TamB